MCFVIWGKNLLYFLQPVKIQSFGRERRKEVWLKKVWRKDNWKSGRLTQQLNHMEQELQEKYCDVGKYVLEKVEKENREIDQLVDQVIEVKRELVRVRGEIPLSLLLSV